MSVRIDEIDVKILHYLRQNARMSNVALADRVGLSPAPCLRRVRALENAGIIRKYVTLLDPHAVNLGVNVFIEISLDLQAEGRLEILEHAIMGRPEILECYLMTGEADYLLRVAIVMYQRMSVSYETFLPGSKASLASSRASPSSR